MISEFVTMLQGAGLSFTTIDHAPEMEPVDTWASKAPALYVMPAEDTAGENIRDNGVRQAIEKEVVVYVVCDTSARESLTDELRSAAMGWQPDTSHDEMILVGGSPAMINGSKMVWQETYQITGYATST